MFYSGKCWHSFMLSEKSRALPKVTLPYGNTEQLIDEINRFNESQMQLDEQLAEVIQKELDRINGENDFYVIESSASGEYLIENAVEQCTDLKDAIALCDDLNYDAYCKSTTDRTYVIMMMPKHMSMIKIDTEDKACQKKLLQ